MKSSRPSTHPETRGTKRSCRCAHCQQACTHKPGWFLPGEIERVAAFMQTDVRSLLATAVAVDCYETPLVPLTFVLSPAHTGCVPGQEMPNTPEGTHGTCVFFHEGRCTIHPVKPFQCREMLHSDGHLAGRHRNARVARAWARQQNQIVTLLGREPHL